METNKLAITKEPNGEVINFMDEKNKRNYEDETPTLKVISMSEGLLKEFLERYFIANNNISEVAEIEQVIDVNIDKLYNIETDVEVGLVSFTVELVGDKTPTTIEVLDDDIHIQKVLDEMKVENPFEEYNNE